MKINPLEIHNRYAKLYIDRVVAIVPVNMIRATVDTYEKYVPLIPLLGNPLTSENPVINSNERGMI